jgi:hypothetical protein
VAQAKEDALDVDPDYCVEHVLVIFGGVRHLAFDPGIVEKAVDGAIGVEGCFDVGLHLGRFGDVGRGEVRRRTLLSDDPGGRLAGRAVAVDNDDLGAALGKGECRGAADAVPRPRDQRDLAGKIQVHLVLPDWIRADSDQVAAESLR